jgi:hypothetical protein
MGNMKMNITDKLMDFNAGRIFTLLTGVMALRLTAPGPPLSATRIRILLMN